MTTQGMQVFNSGGSLVFDTNVGPFVLATKGTISATNSAGAQYTYTYATTSGVHPVLAISCSGNVGFFMYCVSQTGTTTVTYTYTIWIDAICTATIYVFDKAPAITVTGGLAVWDASGNVVYSSSQKPMVVKASVVGTNSTLPSTITGVTGRTYAIVTGRVCFWQFPSPGFDYHWALFHVNGTAITATDVNLGTFAGRIMPPAPQDFSYLVVDVTGY